MIKVPIKISGLEKRRRSIGLLHIVAGFFLVANARNLYNALGLNSYRPLLPLFIIALISLLYGFLRKRMDPQGRFNFLVRLLQALTFLGLAVFFVQAGGTGKSLGLFLWVFISGMLAFTEKIALQQQALVFTPEGVSFPNGYRNKTIPWHTVADVTIRPDFLTIHYPDNRFLQFELAQPLLGEQIAQLQDFCRGQIGIAPANGQA